jgi:hypothetical protein
MIERGRGLSFLLETAQAISIFRKAAGKNLTATSRPRAASRAR